jgi:hypothetical protein
MVIYSRCFSFKDEEVVGNEKEVRVRFAALSGGIIRWNMRRVLCRNWK